MQAIAKAMSERTSRSRSSIRWERKVSWLSWASGIAALLARGAVARRGVGGRRVDSQLELRRGRGGRGRIVGGRGAFLEAALDRGFRVVHLALHLARLRLDLALEGPRRVFELGLHVAERRQLRLAIDIGLHLGHVALQAPEEHAHRARDLGQALGPDHHQGHDAADDELGKAEVEHVWTRGARRGTQEAPAPGTQLFCLSLISPSMVLEDAVISPAGFFSSSPFMPSLKPFTAPPRSAPMLRSFFVPKMSSTMTSTIIQCQMLSEPIAFSSCGARIIPSQSCAEDDPARR